MINKEFAEVLVQYALEIQKRAVIADVPLADRTRVTKRAGNAAWRLTSTLLSFTEHAKESDMFWMLLEIAIDQKKSAKEQFRLNTIAKREDMGFTVEKRKLAEMLKEIVKLEKSDPDCIKEGKAEAKRLKEVAKFKANLEAMEKAHKAAAAVVKKAQVKNVKVVAAPKPKRKAVTA